MKPSLLLALPILAVIAVTGCVGLTNCSEPCSYTPDSQCLREAPVCTAMETPDGFCSQYFSCDANCQAVKHEKYDACVECFRPLTDDTCVPQSCLDEFPEFAANSGYLSMITICEEQKYCETTDDCVNLCGDGTNHGICVNREWLTQNPTDTSFCLLEMLHPCISCECIDNQCTDTACE